MAIHAYSDLYIEQARRTLAEAFDFVILVLKIDENTFFEAFVSSDIAKQFEEGNPKYLVGDNGCQLAREILDEANINYIDKEDYLYLDKSKYYWLGYSLAYYQWLYSYSFYKINKCAPFKEILKLYPLYHQADISVFVTRMDEILSLSLTNLQEKRKTAHLSQNQLAKLANVPLRQIQLFEQRKRDINKSATNTLFKLSKALHCQIEDLLELSSIE